MPYQWQRDQWQRDQLRNQEQINEELRSLRRQQEISDSVALLSAHADEEKRNLVFEAATILKQESGRIDEAPQIALFFLTSMFRILVGRGVKPSAFREFADKEYVQNLLQDYEDAMNRAKAKLSRAEAEEALACEKFSDETLTLFQALRIQLKREKSWFYRPDKAKWQKIVATFGERSSEEYLQMIGERCERINKLFLRNYPDTDFRWENVLK